MDRQIIYSGQVPQTLDLLNTNKQTMIALAKLCADLFGTATMATGLACVPTTPASMSVNVNPGQIYQLANVDGTAYSAIAADTTHSILKQGILMDAQSFAITAPSTAGYSQNYLIQATYLDNDINNSVLPYYNSANPTQALNGPSGNGTSQPTTRAGQVSLQLVAGTAAATGSQTTPAVTTGYVGLWVITVANGQTTITATNITQYAGAPILPSSLLASIQNGNLSYAVATGTANAHTIALTPALTARVDGMMIRYKAPAANTGAVTLADGVGTANVLGANHAALQGGEYVANGDAFVVWNSSIGGGSYILVECTGGAVQIAPATQSQHAVQAARVGTAGGLGRRNVLINATGAINKRGYTSGTNTTTANQYTIDRWYVNTSGQNLSWTTSGGVSTFTAPAGGVTQAIRAQNIAGGTYVLSYTGTATAKINGTAVANGGTISLPANTIARVTFSGGTFSLPQLELGTVQTTFDWPNLEAEQAICARYFYAPGLTWRVAGYGSAAGQNIMDAFLAYPEMVGAPVVVASSGAGANVAVGSISATATGLTQTATTQAAGYAAYTFTVTSLDADFV